MSSPSSCTQLLHLNARDLVCVAQEYGQAMHDFASLSKQGTVAFMFTIPERWSGTLGVEETWKVGAQTEKMTSTDIVSSAVSVIAMVRYVENFCLNFMDVLRGSPRCRILFGRLMEWFGHVRLSVRRIWTR